MSSKPAVDILNATDALLGRLDLAGGCWADVPATDDQPGRPRCATATTHRSGLCSAHRSELVGDTP